MTSMIERRADVAARAAAFLLVLAEQGIPPDVQELLLHGSKREGIAPGAIYRAIDAALKEQP